MARLPMPRGDSGKWGDILNEYLAVSHKDDGTLRPNTVSSETLADGAIVENKLDPALRTKINTVPSASVTSVAGKTGSVTLSKTDIDLTNVDNTSDADKPISNATQVALNAKINKNEIFVVDTDYSSLTSALAAVPTGGILEVRGSYTTTTPLVVDKACTIRWVRGASITASSGNAINITSSNVILESPKLIGSGGSTAGTAAGIQAIATVAAPLTNIRVLNPDIVGFNKYAIYFEHVHDFAIDNPQIKDIAYAAIMFLSCLRGSVKGGYIKNLIQPTGFVNSYGVAMTRNSSQSLAVAPRSEYILVDGVTVEGVTKWEGIDTHAGRNLTITNNKVLNCYIGIACVPCPDSAGNDFIAPINMVVTNNTVDGIREDGLGRAGIQMIGAGAVGAVVEAATGVIANNLILRCGTENTSNGAAISVQNSNKVVIASNTITEPALAGINVSNNNESLVIIGNVITDAWTNSSSFSSSIYIRSNFNTIMIAGNIAARAAKSATIVNQRGLFVAAATTNNTINDLGNDWSNCSQPLVDATNTITFSSAAKKIGFYGVNPVTRPTVNGTRADGTALASLLTNLSSLGLISDVSTAGTLTGSTPPSIDFLTTSASWTKPANAKVVSVILIGGGGGGGSGRRNAAGTVRCGGGGGGGGGFTRATFDATDLLSSFAVSVGAAGQGGSAINLDATDGNSGTAGGQTTFGTYASASGGGGGGGGTVSTGLAGVAGFGTSVSGAGGAASTTGGAGSNALIVGGCSGGGAGGGITSANIANNGGVASQSRSVGVTAGVAGVVDSTPPASAPASSAKGSPGPGGPGGAASITATAQTGALPTGFGGGGGGGGASANGFDSGAGANGAPGCALIITTF